VGGGLAQHRPTEELVPEGIHLVLTVRDGRPTIERQVCVGGEAGHHALDVARVDVTRVAGEQARDLDLVRRRCLVS
jgi:hypothetical protein